ncbi:MAG: hypothetical protein WAW36_08345 [Methylovulum miyakonense]|uniref:hypothetical protein n=1 Tax=Methylovulum miyakonense TaxID=645578 RepID=UPI0003688A1D|nr:hypothetical protein [Methylovulum miyakonense]
MNEEFDLLVDCHAIDAESSETDELPGLDDDRYPGSFFRIPRPPIPGKTEWSLR